MKTKHFVAVVACSMALSVNAQPHHRTDRNRTVQDPLVHDPVIAKEGDTYYMYFTGWNVESMSSKDLRNWRFGQAVFADPPQWALDSIRGYKGHTWAPDVIYHKGNYHMFYSCSTFGKNTSAIGHAYRSTLAPADSIPWIDTGGVVFSSPGKPFNAIDPNVIVDEEGTPWMTFGSFWGGIQLVQLTDDLTAMAHPGEFHVICSRENPDLHPAGVPAQNAVEAPFIFRHGKYYYLFVSFDYCCRGLKSDYKVAVGRSEKVTGPYLDKNGRSMAEGGGSLLVAGNKDFVAVGHSAAYHFDGKDYFVAHGYSRKRNGESLLVLREMQWDEDGWPVVEL